jgi:hypothetical protein
MSNTILVGDRSLNTTSTASRLMFVRLLSSSHHRLRRRRLKSLSTICDHPARNPSPFLRVVGTTNSLQVTSEARTQPTRPSPFQRDVGGLYLLDGGFGDGRTQGGTHEIGGPQRASRNTVRLLSGEPGNHQPQRGVEKESQGELGSETVIQ